MDTPIELWALTVRQPWAWALARADIENRSWTTTYRGWLAIHAGRALVDDVACAQGFIAARLGPRWRPHHPRQSLRARGQVLALARLDAVCDGPAQGCRCRSPWATPGQFHWHFGAWHALRQTVAAVGAQGLWRLPATATATVLTYLDDPARHEVMAHA
ncbi:hypothetical protein [Nonomuraea typhae]|uniref:hypothetical protein n=1 Tax=Nonomuraea typhae TaxID=2603600 RepID=UPI0012F70AF3|nr:hypothetical protein [Nonomuraea typhae]